MMIQKISIGPPRACVSSKNQFYPPYGLQATKRSDRFHLAKRADIKQRYPLAAHLDQLVCLQFRDAVCHSLAIHAELIGHLLMGVSAHLLASTGQLEEQRRYSRCHRLKCGLLMPSFGVHKPRSDLAGKVESHRRRSTGDFLEVRRTYECDLGCVGGHSLRPEH